MTIELTRAEKNRRIAEALGYKFIQQAGSRTVFDEDDPCCFYPIDENYTCEVMHLLDCCCPINVVMSSCIDKSCPDFYTDEATNALIVDALITTSAHSLDIYREVTATIWYHRLTGAKRMEAICEAFLKWKECV